jgi:hypothetical protein
MGINLQLGIFGAKILWVQSCVSETDTLCPSRPVSLHKEVDICLDIRCLTLNNVQGRGF